MPEPSRLPEQSLSTGSDPVSGFAGLVSAGTPEAARVGARILASGGNAADAAVAVSLALAVTEPAASGLGGQAMLLFHPFRGEPVALLGSSHAPLSMPSAVRPFDLIGHRLSTTPSLVRLLDHVLEKFGSGRFSWAQLLEPAIVLASEGWRLGEFRHWSLSRYRLQLWASPSAGSLFLNPDGSVPGVDSVIRQPRLAATLIRLAEAGAEDFYSGQIAREICRDMEESGGWIRLEDLRSFPPPRLMAPLRRKFRGWDVYSLPPPAGGWAILLALALLDQEPPGSLAQEGFDRDLRLASALLRAHRERAAGRLRNMVNYSQVLDEIFEPGRLARIGSDWKGCGGETTHFTLADGGGNLFSVTQSLNNLFGSKTASSRLGVLYNDYLREFDLEDHSNPFFLKPLAVPFSSMGATIVASQGVPHLGLGSPGSERIISIVTQVVQYWIDVAADIRAAVSAPRLHVAPARPRSRIYLEKTHFEVPLQAWASQGFQIEGLQAGFRPGALNPFFGGVHAVACQDDGWQGAADPRRDGSVETATLNTTSR